MAILNISPDKFRNLVSAEVVFHQHMNIVVGLNASGKTSLLEAIYFLLTGKSFRSHRSDNIICRDTAADKFILFGNIREGNSGQRAKRVGIQKARESKSIIMVDNRKIQSASELVKISPIIVIDPTSFDLLYGGPGVRRKFMDWGVFHVEHLFSKRWSEYNYCLKQRNTLLRADKIDLLQLNAWDRRLASLGEDIHHYRASYARELAPILSKNAQSFLLNDQLEVRYMKGWDKNLSLDESLKKYRSKDSDRKFTQHGPHRADLKLTVDGLPAEDILSRGQQKLLIMALYLSQLEYLRDKASCESVVLIDDVAAELDEINLRKVFVNLQALNTQVICTTLELSKVEFLFSGDESYKVFHVEHGSITAQQH